MIGRSVRRVEDRRFVTGRGQFVDDIAAPGVLHVAFVRSPYAHAAIRGIDGSGALAIPGVVAVVTASDLGPANGPFPHPTWFPPHPPLAKAVNPFTRPEWIWLLAAERARFAGEAVAAVVAEDRYVAEDAIREVLVDYEPLPVLATAEAALAPGAPLLTPEWGDNIAVHFVIGSGDIDRAFAEADVFVFPTRYEPFGMVVAEALACGVPVVTSAAAGAADLLTPMKHGAVVPDPLDAQAFAAAIDAAPSLKVISKHGSGTDTIDKVAATERGIKVVAAVGANVSEIRAGDHVMGCFFPHWQDGAVTPEYIRDPLGGAVDGMLAQLVVLPATAGRIKRHPRSVGRVRARAGQGLEEGEMRREPPEQVPQAP